MEQTVTIDANGSLTLPNEYRKILGLLAGDKITVQLKGNKLVLLSPHDPVKIVQTLVRKYIPAERSLADELIAERRREAASE
ncbi:MAG: AbrB/MazE/SpoVT family DNA-binding domain-containing protein [Candidatus Parabeggiatoa sp. nov. 2]|nr:MAG: hypothetical protein B6247_18520 [Beggiatoa sp. 4572_84]RKZ60352.1 MAG: AbrB/MazE/SpoVT family DNA-binding domain-containing protein [Gammaproteobacteria bacterium]HEC85764.1 AbrB/MazE/SpoVT family DNA-binding domain-containing protein [Thioploca sp.]